MRGQHYTISARQVSVGVMSGGATIFWGARPTGTNMVTGLIQTVVSESNSRFCSFMNVIVLQLASNVLNNLPFQAGLCRSDLWRGQQFSGGGKTHRNQPGDGAVPHFQNPGSA